MDVLRGSLMVNMTAHDPTHEHVQIASDGRITSTSQRTVSLLLTEHLMSSLPVT
jgi:hypothetical protein